MSAFNPTDIPKPHPLFGGEVLDLQLPENKMGDEQLRYMRVLLRRNPQNLRCHVQYIFLLLRDEPKNNVAIKGALLDLFIVLGEKGFALRERMLMLCKESISNEDYAFFTQHIAKGLSDKTQVTGIVDSFITLSLSGNGLAITKQKEAKVKVELSLFEEAMAMLEQGDVDEARDLLERAIKLQPEQEKIAEELLAIYKSQRDDEALAGIRQWYLDNDLTLPACWPLM